MVYFRYIFAFLGAWVMGIFYSTKVCMSLALMAMLNHTALALADKTLDSGINPKQDGPFTWSVMDQQIIISAYFIGYIVSEIPGGILAETWSGKWTLTIALTINTFCLLLIPQFSYVGYVPVIILRVGQGIGGGCSFPAMHHMLARWAPKEERSFINSIVYTGLPLGVVLANLSSGLIASYFGWSYIFYVFGIVSIIITFFWTTLMTDSPREQPRFMDQEEIDYILASLGEEFEVIEKPSLLPISVIFSNVPFWAVLISHTCSNWGWYMVTVEFPIYMKTVLDTSLSKNAVHSAAPYFLLWLFATCLGKIMDRKIRKNPEFISSARKIATGICSLIPAFCILVVSFFGASIKIITLIAMYIGIIAYGAMFSGFLCTHIDLSPEHAATLMAITNTVATLPGIVMPLVVGAVTSSNIHDQKNWRYVFYITILLLLIEFTVFTIWGSAEDQNLDDKTSFFIPPQDI